MDILDIIILLLFAVIFKDLIAIIIVGLFGVIICALMCIWDVIYGIYEELRR